MMLILSLKFNSFVTFQIQGDNDIYFGTSSTINAAPDSTALI